MTLSASASDATYYGIKITDENDATFIKSGGEALSTSAGQSDGNLTFTVAASSPTEAGIHFVKVTANNSETFEESPEFRHNYTLSLPWTTDYNSPPFITVNGLISNAYDLPAARRSQAYINKTR